LNFSNVRRSPTEELRLSVVLEFPPPLAAFSGME
jgi:hypothetical protein